MAGEYTLQVEHASCGSSMETVVVKQPSQVRAVVSGIETVQCNTGSTGMITFEVENASWFSYEVRNSVNEVVRSANIEGSQELVEGLSADVYSIHVFTACGHETLEVDLRDEQANALIVEQVVLDNQGGNTVVQLDATAAQVGLITWSFSDGANYVGSTIQLELPDNETVSYTVSCAGVCGAAVSGTVQATSLGINDVSREQSVVFAQSANAVQLLFKQDNASQVQMQLFDAQGRLLEQQKFVATGGSMHEMSTEELASGIYTLVLCSDEQKVFTQKFIK
jgi:hypothetical protein